MTTAIKILIAVSTKPSAWLLVSAIFALIATLIIAVLIIFSFNYYISVAKELNFKARFFEMTFISLGVATFSFFVGYALKAILGVEI